MEYFILRSTKKLEESQHAYSIPGLKTDLGADMGMLRPLDTSIQTKLLEWRIPNNGHNQNWVSLHFSHFEIIAAGEEQTLADADIKLMPNMPPLPKPKDPKLTNKKTKKITPMVAKKLKAEYVKKLKALKVEIPEKATLKILKALYETSTE